LLRFETGLGKQFKEFALRALVDGDFRQLAVAVEDKGLRNSFDVILLVYGFAGMRASGLGAAILIVDELGTSRDCEIGDGVDE
jgi:hypothetical protein